MTALAICQTPFPALKDSDTVGDAARAGTSFRFVEYLKVAFPLMLMSIVLCHVYIQLRYL